MRVDTSKYVGIDVRGESGQALLSRSIYGQIAHYEHALTRRGDVIRREIGEGEEEERRNEIKYKFDSFLHVLVINSSGITLLLKIT